MTARTRLALIGHELKEHSPFTLLGAVTGIALMLLFQSANVSKTPVLFSIFHPLHVVLSAMVTSSLFLLHRKAKQFLLILVVGYTGSIGVATLSDCIIPFFGEEILGVVVPTESKVHGSHDEGTPEAEKPGGTTPMEVQHKDEHGREEGVMHRLHLGFIEEWYLVNPAALLGIVIAFYLPRSKVPHAAHILISTWASSAHILMNTPGPYSVTMLVGILIVLFIAVWLPCCFSDIIFPMLLVNPDPDHKECWLGHHH